MTNFSPMGLAQPQMSTGQFWAMFGTQTATTIVDKVISYKQQEKQSDVEAYKSTIEDLKEQIQKIEYEKVMMIREVARLEYQNEILQEKLKSK